MTVMMMMRMERGEDEERLEKRRGEEEEGESVFVVCLWELSKRGRDGKKFGGFFSLRLLAIALAPAPKLLIFRLWHPQQQHRTGLVLVSVQLTARKTDQNRAILCFLMVITYMQFYSCILLYLLYICYLF